MPLLWTDDLADRVSRDAEHWRCEPADVLTWVCLASGAAIAALIVALLLLVFAPIQ